MKMRDTFLKPMHPEGRKFVGVFAAITLLLFLVSSVMGWIGIGLTIWCYYFFRDPVRITPERDGLIVSPADGIVSLIEKAIPPTELGMPDLPLTRVSVFMSVFNCHVNRARRIVCFSADGDTLRTGERFGLIRFGSRLDVYLPDGVSPMVSLGQTMVAGETVLADLLTSEPTRIGRAD